MCVYTYMYIYIYIYICAEGRPGRGRRQRRPCPPQAHQNTTSGFHMVSIIFAIVVIAIIITNK